MKTRNLSELFSGVKFKLYRRGVICLMCLMVTSLLAIGSFGRAEAGGLIRDAEIEALLWDYAEPIFIAAGLNPDHVDIGIIDDKRLNAFVTGGKNIYFHTGLILEADHPNMVIGVIAHETGHITGGHLARSSEAMGKARTPILLGTLLGIGAIAAGQSDLGMGLMGLGQQAALGSYLSFSRAQEAAADQVALDLLQATGQSAEGILDMMNMLAGQEILSEVQQDPYIRSHPLSRDRVNFMQHGVDESKFSHVTDSPELQFRHDMAKAKIYGFLDHPGTTFRRYRRDDSLPAQYAKAIAYYKQGQTGLALTHIDRLIKTMPENPFFFELKGQVLYEAGKIAQSTLPYQKAVALAPDMQLIRLALATAKIALEKENEAQEAIRELKIVLRQEPENASAYYQMAIAYAQTGQPGRAELATAERFYLYGDKQKAKQHATRAMKILRTNSPEWLRAVDISSSS